MKIGVLIGRFQVPFLHDGHKSIITQALMLCDRLIILAGSANKAPSIRNPFSYAYREQLIYASLPAIGECTVVPLNDYKYSDTQWMMDVRSTIASVTQPGDSIILFGHYKDGNDYLTWFPEYKYHNLESDIDVDGTRIRERNIHLLPISVQEDIKYFAKERELFKDYPYPGTLSFNCADAVVTCYGHILLIKRGGSPGIGNWALPGGFKNANETFLECALRELVEETNLRVPEKVLRGSVKATKMYDSPTRGCGIPRNTMGVHIEILPNADGSLPRANGKDDAMHAEWVLLDKAMNTLSFHDDHGDIIMDMTGVKPLPAYLNKSLRSEPDDGFGF